MIGLDAGNRCCNVPLRRHYVVLILDALEVCCLLVLVLTLLETQTANTLNLESLLDFHVRLGHVGYCVLE